MLNSISRLIKRLYNNDLFFLINHIADVNCSRVWIPVNSMNCNNPTGYLLFTICKSVKRKPKFYMSAS